MDSTNKGSNTSNSHYRTLATTFLLEKTESEHFNAHCRNSHEHFMQSGTVRKLLNTTWTVYKHIAEMVRVESFQCDSEEVMYPNRKHSRSAEIMSKILAEHTTVEQVKEFIKNEKPWDRVKRTFMEE